MGKNETTEVDGPLRLSLRAGYALPMGNRIVKGPAIVNLMPEDCRGLLHMFEDTTLLRERLGIPPRPPRRQTKPVDLAGALELAKLEVQRLEKGLAAKGGK